LDQEGRRRAPNHGLSKRLPPAVPAVGPLLQRPIEAADLMLASTARGPFDDDDWLYELKIDGYRCLPRIESGKRVLISRQGNMSGLRFPTSWRRCDRFNATLCWTLNWRSTTRAVISFSTCWGAARACRSPNA
jgi:hypothetical protein